MRPFRPLRWAVRGVVLAGLAGFLVSGCFARRMTYLPPNLPTPSPPPAPFEEIALPTSQGSCRAWWRPPGGLRPETATQAVLFFYGNGSSLEACRRAGILDRIAQTGAGLFCPDYPGYGESAGSPSEKALAETADAAILWLTARCPGVRLVVMGQSLGSGVAVAAAVRHRENVSGLILLAPFTSLADVARAHYPGWFVWLALRERYDSIAAICQIEKPVLILHGDSDEIIPVEQGRRLAAAAGNQARFARIPGAMHNDLTDFPRVWEEIRMFVKSLLSPQ